MGPDFPDRQDFEERRAPAREDLSEASIARYDQRGLRNRVLSSKAGEVLEFRQDVYSLPVLSRQHYVLVPEGDMELIYSYPEPPSFHQVFSELGAKGFLKVVDTEQYKVLKEISAEDYTAAVDRACQKYCSPIHPPAVRLQNGQVIEIHGEPPEAGPKRKGA
ncbi:hypothetical protein EBR25_01400 [bacterium]|jgi:hypothetical protein|nr:hypothetical protein [bacterium]